MSISRHLVDPEIAAMLDMPALDLADETLAEIRASPMFNGSDLPPPPFPVREVFAPVRDGPDVRLLVIFLDDYHLKFGALEDTRIKADLVRFVQSEVRPRDLVAVMGPLAPSKITLFRKSKSGSI